MLVSICKSVTTLIILLGQHHTMLNQNHVILNITTMPVAQGNVLYLIHCYERHGKVHVRNDKQWQTAKTSLTHLFCHLWRKWSTPNQFSPQTRHRKRLLKVGEMISPNNQYTRNLCLCVPFLTPPSIPSTHRTPFTTKNRSPSSNRTPFLVNHAQKTADSTSEWQVLPEQ